jgi:hypothetical protein
LPEQFETEEIEKVFSSTINFIIVVSKDSPYSDAEKAIAFESAINFACSIIHKDEGEAFRARVFDKLSELGLYTNGEV